MWCGDVLRFGMYHYAIMMLVTASMLLAQPKMRRERGRVVEGVSPWKSMCNTIWRCILQHIFHSPFYLISPQLTIPFLHLYQLRMDSIRIKNTRWGLELMDKQSNITMIPLFCSTWTLSQLFLTMYVMWFKPRWGVSQSCTWWGWCSCSDVALIRGFETAQKLDRQHMLL